MSAHENPVIRQVIRYGLPVVIAVFYFTASLGFAYTPDTSYGLLLAAKGLLGGLGFLEFSYPDVVGSVSPAWVFLLALGGRLGLDLSLTAKILSLFFSCTVILAAYLVAVEMLGDRVTAFCVSLILGTSGWMLELAPAGTAFPLGLTLTLVAVFFGIRNDYLLAAFLSALAMMVFWQAVGLLALLLLDAVLNSVDKQRGLRLAGGVLLVGIAGFLPWVVIAVSKGLPVLTILLPSAHFPQLGVADGAVLLLTGVLALGGLVWAAMKADERGRFLLAQVIPLLWMLWLLLLGSFGARDLWLMTLPLFVPYAFLGLVHFAPWFRGRVSIYTLMFALTGVLLLLNQVAFRTVWKPAMVETVEESAELTSIAMWLKTAADAELSVSADRPGLLTFTTDRPIRALREGVPPTTTLVISRRDLSGEYVPVYRTEMKGYDTSGTLPGCYTVWKRK